MYTFHNTNSLGLFKDDCVIRSISCATHRSWDDVYDELCHLAKRNGTIMSDREFVIEYLDNLYPRVYVDDINVGDVADLYRDCIVLITMRNHITCAKYGIIYDTFNPSDEQAEFCWIVQ